MKHVHVVLCAGILTAGLFGCGEAKKDSKMNPKAASGPIDPNDPGGTASPTGNKKVDEGGDGKRD